jgi:hypothetical protein
VPSAADIRSEMRGLELTVNVAVAAACGASADDIAQRDAPVGEAGSCYADYAVAYDSCEAEYLPGRPAEAHAVLGCQRALFDDLFACCTRDGDCTRERLARCDAEVWTAERLAACDALFAVFEADYEACAQD